MRHLCFSKILLFLFLLSISSAYASQSEKSAAVYYGHDISYSNLGLHDYIIIESENISPYTHGFKTYKKKIFAYVSVGEASSYRAYFKDLKERWKLSQNETWESTVMDISNDDYHSFMYDNVIQPLIDKGYENFFFDTLDSYQIVAKDEEERIRYTSGLIRFVKKFKQRFPDSKLIVNRGFEVMDEIHESVHAVLFESLFYGLSSKTLSYTQVSEEDRQWLLTQVEKVKKYNLDVIDVDYIQTQEKEKIRQTLEKIRGFGIIPYISNKEFTRYGDSSKSVFKREVLVLYSDSEPKVESNAHHLAAMPLEYLGYIPVLRAVEEGLPDRDELSRYAAVISWSESPYKDAHAFVKWVETVMQEKIKILFLDGFGVEDDTEICRLLQIEKEANQADILEKETVVYQDGIFGLEAGLNLSYAPTLYRPKSVKNLLHLRNTYGQEHVPAALMSWGGYALTGSVSSGFGVDILWVMDPFKMFKEALSLESIPVPDPTTQNGRRLLFAHIDGDAAMNKAEWDPRSYSIGVTYEKILKKYAIPQSVSLVEAETDPKGLYPKDSEALEAIAKKIYALPYVEAATHTYSHPFEWKKITHGKLSPEYRLDIKGYAFSIERELQGSLDYINSRLLPAGKKPANVVYWTGDCMPKADVLEYAYKHGILNINGGDTIITNDKPWLSLVAPFGIKRGEFRQVYTGAENENVYTNNFTGPFWGYKKVIQTFELTERPRRLKPIDIYYHFYAASKRASLTALDEVYRWALSQETMPIYTSEYIPKVLEFYDLSMYKTERGWGFKGMKELKTLRLDTSDIKVSYHDSQSLMGEKNEGEKTYLHLNTEVDDMSLEFGPEEDGMYLIDTNAEVLSYRRADKEISFRLKAHLDIVLNYHLKEGCTLESAAKVSEKRQSGANILMKFDAKEADVLIRCQ